MEEDDDNEEEEEEEEEQEGEEEEEGPVEIAHCCFRCCFGNTAFALVLGRCLREMEAVG